MSQSERILFLDDDASVQGAILKILEEDYTVIAVQDEKEATEKLRSERVDLFLANGLELLKKVKQINPELPVILISMFKDLKTVTEAMRLGAADYIVKPFEIKELRNAVQETLERRELSNLPRVLQNLIGEVKRKTLEQNLTLKEAIKNFEKEFEHAYF